MSFLLFFCSHFTYSHHPPLILGPDGKFPDFHGTRNPYANEVESPWRTIWWANLWFSQSLRTEKTNLEHSALRDFLKDGLEKKLSDDEKQYVQLCRAKVLGSVHDIKDLVSACQKLLCCQGRPDIKLHLAQSLLTLSTFLCFGAIRSIPSITLPLMESSLEKNPAYALLLLNISSRFAALGFIEHARLVAEKYASLSTLGERCHSPRHDDPDDSSSQRHPHDVRALVNLSARFFDAGEDAVATRHMQEALRICSSWERSDSNAHLYELVATLNRSSMQKLEYEQAEDALKDSQKAVRLCRKLYRDSPEQFSPIFSSTQVTLSRCFSSLECWDDALQASREAVRLIRTLKEPGVHRPDLARALDCLSRSLAAVGQFEEAVTEGKCAVEEFASLVDKQNAMPYTLDYAKSLSNLSTRYSELGHRGQALSMIQRAVHYLEKLVARSVGLAIQYRYSSPSSVLQKEDDGRRIFAKAFETLTRGCSFLLNDSAKSSDITIHPPFKFIWEYVLSLTNLASRFSDAGQHEDALLTVRHAETFYLNYSEYPSEARVPRRYVLGRISNLICHSEQLVLRGFHLEALDEITRADEYLKDYLKRRRGADRDKTIPVRVRVMAAALLQCRSDRYHDLAQEEDAWRNIEVVVESFRGFLVSEGQATHHTFTSGLAASLRRQSDRLAQMSEQPHREIQEELERKGAKETKEKMDKASVYRQKSLESIQEALSLHRELAALRPDLFLPEVARSLRTLSKRLLEKGRSDQAFNAIHQCLDLYRTLVPTSPAAFTTQDRPLSHIGDDGTKWRRIFRSGSCGPTMQRGIPSRLSWQTEGLPS